VERLALGVGQGNALLAERVDEVGLGLGGVLDESCQQFLLGHARPRLQPNLGLQPFETGFGVVVHLYRGGHTGCSIFY